MWMSIIGIIVYMAWLICLATAAPGIGLLGGILLCIPPTLLDGLHAPAYGLLAWLLIRTLKQRGWPMPYALLVGSLSALVFGLWTEVFQGAVPGRGPESTDLVLDATGIVVAAAIAQRRTVFRTQCPHYLHVVMPMARATHL